MSHELINPGGMPPAAGFSHVVRPTDGRLVFLAGQTAHDADGVVQGETFAAQFAAAIENVRMALDAVEGQPEDVVWIQLFTTDVEAYLDDLESVGEVYRRAFGKHFPAMSMFEVSRLVDPSAIIELVCMAVVPMRA